MKSKIAIILVFLGILGCSKSGDKVDELIRSGYAHLENFEFDKAEEAFNEIVKTDTTLPYTRLANGLILEQQRYYFDALNEYLQLTEQYPDFAPGYAGIYRIYTYYGIFDKALSASNSGYELASDSIQFAIDQFRALLNFNRLTQAKELALEHKRALDNLSSRYLLARSLCFLDDYDSAKIVLENTNSIPPTNVYHFELLADALEELGLIDSSMKVSRQAVSDTNSKVANLNAHFNRALRNNYYFDARELIKKLESRGAPKNITLQMEVHIAQDKGEYPEAILINGELASVSPKNISSLFFDMTSSGQQFSDVSVRSSLSSTINSRLAALKFHPEVQEFVKAQSELFMAGTDDKVSAWNSIRKLTGEFARKQSIIMTEAELRYKTGQFDDAMKYLDKLVKSKANDPNWLTSIADIYADPEIKKNELAQETYLRALSKDSWNKAAFYNSIAHLRRIGETKKALKRFEEFPHFEKTFHKAALFKALCLFESKNYENGFELIESRGKFVKGNLEPFFELMSILEDNYRHDDVVRLAGICADWSEENPDIMNFAAMFLNDNGKFDRALELTEKALVIEPRSVTFRVQRARALFGQGQRAESFEIFEEILKENPTSGAANYYYSGILASEKIDAQRTTNMARSAVRSFYSDKKSIMNVCRAYLAFDMDKFAYGEARGALKFYPERAEFWYFLGVSSEKLGRADAEKNLNKAIELGLRGEDLKNAKEILARL